MMVMINLKLDTYHVYNLTFRSAVMIAMCNMQFEETKYQSCMWYLMIKRMKLHNITRLYFHKSKTNFAQTN